MKAGWDLIKKDIDTDEPAPANLYLGCKHEFKESLPSHGKGAHRVIYNMEDYLNTIVEKYKELCYAATGEMVVLRKAATPFIDEDAKIVGPKTPVKDGPCVLCTYCGNTMPDDGESKFKCFPHT